MLISNIKNEKVKLVKAVFANKLGKKITDEILMPILNQLEDDAYDIMNSVAQWAEGTIVDYLQSITPSGRTYKIYSYDPDMPRGQRTTLLSEHTASAPGQPPASLTGTLINSIEYKVNADGSFQVGLLKKFGEFSEAQTEFQSAFYKGGKIFVNDSFETSKQTPVGTYGEYLATGTDYMDERPFFRHIMRAMRPGIRRKIRQEIRRSLNKATRRISVRRAIVFKVYFQ